MQVIFSVTIFLRHDRLAAAASHLPSGCLLLHFVYMNNKEYYTRYEIKIDSSNVYPGMKQDFDAKNLCQTSIFIHLT